MTRNDNTFFFFPDISLMSNCVVSSNTKLLHFFCFLLLHLLLSFLSPRRCSFSASFFFFLFFFLHFFTSIASSFFLSLLFSTLHVDAFKGFIVLFYGFICFWISGFCLGLCKGGRDDGRIFVHGLCVLCSGWVKGWDRWVWVVGSGRRRSGSSSGFGSDQV